MGTPTPSSEWLTVAEAAQRLGVTPQWVRQLARTGRLRGTQSPQGWLIDPSDVERRVVAMRPAED